MTVLGRFALLRWEEDLALAGVYGGPEWLELVCVILLVYDITQGLV